jgi:hypothetical protein
MTTAAPSFKVIFNDCYGGFKFSAAFEAEYRKRTGWDLMAEKRLFRNGPESVRRDPVAITLLEEKGAEWSSGANAYLAIRTIPALFERYWTIEEYDGNESVYVNIPEAYADLLHVYMGDGDHAKLTDGYRRVRAAARALTEERGLLKPTEVGGTTDKPSTPVDVSGSGGYAFFDSSGDDDDTIAHD